MMRSKNFLQRCSKRGGNRKKLNTKKRKIENMRMNLTKLKWRKKETKMNNLRTFRSKLNKRCQRRKLRMRQWNMRIILNLWRSLTNNSKQVNTSIKMIKNKKNRRKNYVL
jgi:hypothetical protein